TTRLSRDGEPVYHHSFISSFAEATVLPERSCVPIPRDVPFEVAGLVGCAVTTGVGAVWRTAGVRPGDRVAVIGCGGVGLSAVLAAAAGGARAIVAVDLSPHKLAAAEEFGGTDGVLWAGPPEQPPDAPRGRQPDVCRRDRHVHAPFAGPHTGARLRRPRRGELRADLAADVDDEQGYGARRPA